VSISRKCLFVVSWAALGTASLVSAQQSSVPTSANDLNTCAPIPSQSERLACYDKLAGRGPAVTAPNSTGTQAPAATTPNAARTRAPPAAPATSETAAQPAPATPSTTVVPKEAFGIYKEEHPVVAKSETNSITAKVAGVSYDPYGRETITLEEAGLWQLDGSDPLLASGDSVTIKRATFGSYVLTTASGRTHHVRRLR
jgi:hypothetical protein